MSSNKPTFDGHPGTYAAKNYTSDSISGSLQAIFLYCREVLSSPSSSQPYSGLTSQPHPPLNDLTSNTGQYECLTRMKKSSVRRITWDPSSRTTTMLTSHRTPISETYPDQEAYDNRPFSVTHPSHSFYSIANTTQHCITRLIPTTYHTGIGTRGRLPRVEFQPGDRTVMGEPSRIAHRYAIHVLKLFIPLNAVGYSRPSAPLAYTSIPLSSRLGETQKGNSCRRP